MTALSSGQNFAKRFSRNPNAIKARRDVAVKYSTDLISNEYKIRIRVIQPKSRLFARLVLGLSLLTASSAFAQQRQGQPEDDASAAPSAQAASNLLLAATTIRTETQILKLRVQSRRGFCSHDLRLPVDTQGGLHHPRRRLGWFLERQRVQCCSDVCQDKRTWRNPGP